MISMKDDTATLTTFSANETYQFGATFSQSLRDEDIVALYGELGSGKTTLIQGICSGLQVQQVVTSPSFALIHEYQGRYPIFHFDFYRLESPAAVEQLDIDGYLNSGGISLIEWAERAEFFLPDKRFSIHIERTLQNGAWTTEQRVIRIKSPRSLKKLRSSIHARIGN
jgi:tRNA threonylcarbamoyladenosine biosynthesis protein TsaE